MSHECRWDLALAYPELVYERHVNKFETEIICLCVIKNKPICSNRM